MVNFEAKTHTFLTLFPSFRARILASCTGTGAVFFESTPSAPKIPSWAKGTAQRRHADVILSRKAAMSVHLIASFAARVVGESRLRTLLLYERRFVCLRELVSDRRPLKQVSEKVSRDTGTHTAPLRFAEVLHLVLAKYSPFLRSPEELQLE